MNRRALLALVWMVGSVASSPAQESKEGTVVRSLRTTGQLGVGVEPKMYSKRDLLKIPAVLDELKVTDDQREALKGAEKEDLLETKRLYQQIQQAKAQLKQGDDPAAEQAFRRETLNYAKKLTRSVEKPYLKVLDKKQAKRLEEIQIRADGYMAFERPDVLDRLGLTPEQAEAIDARVAASRRSVFAATAIAVSAATDSTTMSEEQKQALLATKDYQAEVEKVQARVIEARSAALREIRKLLTNPQQATFKNMAGEPFDFGKLNPVRDGATVPPEK